MKPFARVNVQYSLRLDFERALSLWQRFGFGVPCEPPDWFLPPRQYLANAYLSADKYADAERVYRADLKRHRANGWALRGLEQALRKQGKTAEADRTLQEFERAWKRADVQLTASRF